MCSNVREFEASVKKMLSSKNAFRIEVLIVFFPPSINKKYKVNERKRNAVSF